MVRNVDVRIKDATPNTMIAYANQYREDLIEEVSNTEEFSKDDTYKIYLFLAETINHHLAQKNFSTLCSLSETVDKLIEIVPLKISLDNDFLVQLKVLSDLLEDRISRMLMTGGHHTT